MSSGLHRLAVAASIVAFCVIVLGAYVRLSHAGLGCPDWPGCYGQLSWPDAAHEVAAANESFPERPVESHKAWKEMLHRYLAGFLVLLVVAINFLAWKPANNNAGQRGLTAAILVLILFQAALGMWTVTLKLLPVVVMGHLMGGMTTLALLLWLSFRTSIRGQYTPASALRPLRTLAITSLFVLTLQIALGGWTSANYSALACPDFPTCQGELWPQADFVNGFTLSREIGVDYEGGVLDLRARVAIQFVHRLGALATFLVLAYLAFRLIRISVTQRSGIVLMFLLFSQVTLGILNIVLYLPLANAVLHNAVAALLLAHLIWLLNRVTPGRN
jgi:cytochrome c oxidase assembly protein subunit 15